MPLALAPLVCVGARTLSPLVSDLRLRFFLPVSD